MSAKTRRLLPALIIGCMTPLLLAACGGKESEPSATPSAASSRSEAGNPSTARSPVVPGRSAAAERTQHQQPQHHRQGEKGVRPMPPRPSPQHGASRRNGGNVIERILGSASSDRGDQDAARGRRALDQLLAKARKEGIKVVGQDGGGGEAEGILQKLGGGNP
jgi:hypothetical protein